MSEIIESLFIPLRSHRLGLLNLSQNSNAFAMFSAGISLFINGPLVVVACVVLAFALFTKFRQQELPLIQPQGGDFRRALKEGYDKVRPEHHFHCFN